MSKRGIILMNLGSPDSTAVIDLKKYLTEFLMDERVIDKPFIYRALLVKGIIVPFRAKNSAEAYEKIWTENGSPLIVLTNGLQKALQAEMPETIEVSMRYGKPDPQMAYENLLKSNPDLEEVILVPLYPHYAMSSYETAVEYMKKVYAKNKYSFALKTVPPFYNHPAYINALAENIQSNLPQKFDRLLFSYHGIPERHIYKTDKTNSNHNLSDKEKCCDNPEAQKTCYRYQVMETTRLVTEQLGLDKSKYQISYQSRLGRDPWLQPNTQDILPKFVSKGVFNLAVVCPSFVSDCLETLEEIDIRGREDYLQSGGETFTYIPCLNVNNVWVKALQQIINETK